MENREKMGEKRTQRDYTMSFKLGLVSRIEKGEFTFTDRHSNIMAFRGEVPFWSGSENMVT